jgi:hypothetical protein
VARWRIQRAWAMETALIDNQMDHMTDQIAKTYESTDEPTRAALAFRDLTGKSPVLELLLRQEAHLTRQFDRCLKRPTSLRAKRHKEMQSEPNPTNEHQDDHQLSTPRPIQGPQPAPPGVQLEPKHSAAQPAPEMAGIHLQTRRHDHQSPAGPPSALPRAA